jgi:hypothetical protein
MVNVNVNALAGLASPIAGRLRLRLRLGLGLGLGLGLATAKAAPASKKVLLGRHETLPELRAQRTAGDRLRNASQLLLRDESRQRTVGITRTVVVLGNMEAVISVLYGQARDPFLSYLRHHSNRTCPGRSQTK